MIINISGDISLIEANDAATYVQELAGDDANIIFGAMYDESAQDEANITVIATGLDTPVVLSLIHISEPTRQAESSYAVFCLNKNKKVKKV